MIKYFECENDDHNDFSNVKILNAKIAITTIFQILWMKYTHTNSKSLLQNI